ncbi:MAG: hypothetical protein CVV46_02815 [Spirochaetae bacterium HGW-Spirochaetae-2]|jgi:pyruvate/2-oxoglutarate dehydrogenase complex dihydrolipoamide acyltransferase (E2) component|nr:MAG: hypothetical protein CVV46_02815 [Spirochaetae bacterium HGW-Spirochaetae-2]
MRIPMPQIGDSQDPYEVLEWCAHTGDLVEEGMVLCTVEVGKATVDVGAPTSGRLQTIFVKEGQEVMPGTVLCELSANLAF